LIASLITSLLYLSQFFGLVASKAILFCILHGTFNSSSDTAYCLFFSLIIFFSSLVRFLYLLFTSCLIFYTFNSFFISFLFLLLLLLLFFFYFYYYIYIFLFILYIINIYTN